MNPRTTLQRKVIYLVAIAALLVPLYLLSQPPTPSGEGQSPGGKLAQLRDEYELSQSHLGEMDPTGEAIKLALLGLRGVAGTVLWEKADDYKTRKDWTNLSATLEQLTKLQPHFPNVWQFQGWNLAFNVSHEFDDYRWRYRYVIRGLDYMQGGIKYNKREASLLWHLGWTTAQKICRSDEKQFFRKMFKEDNDYHGTRPLAERDGWLVAREWYLRVEDAVRTLQARIRMSPLMYRSDPPKCLISYAENLEVDGTFGEAALRAWQRAAKQWLAFGEVDLPFSDGSGTYRINDADRKTKQVEELVAQLEALAPGQREKLQEEKLEKLKQDPEIKKALETPAAERSAKQRMLADQTEALAKQVPYREVAGRAEKAKQPEAFALVDQIEEIKKAAARIEQVTAPINYLYWRVKAEAEQMPECVEARAAFYRGAEQFSQGNLPESEEQYDRGFELMRVVIDKYPLLATHESASGDWEQLLNGYKGMLKQREKPFPPKDFPLPEILKDSEQN